MPPKQMPDWPEEPYKGLAYYTAADRRLYAGRERDITLCTQRMTIQSTSVFLLYGTTGCGKSSFLRAGLIPNVEELEANCTFLSEYDEDTDRHVPVFIRSTDDPLYFITRAVYNYIKTARVSGFDDHKLDVDEAFLGAKNRKEFVKLCRRPKNLIKSLTILAEQLPTTLIIILDQAEEVLTLNAEENKYKKLFFQFLKLFMAAQINVKFLVALRSEHLGEFRDHSRLEGVSEKSVLQFQLKDMTAAQVRQAMLRPTRRNERDAPPYDFDFDPTTEETLMDDLFQSRRTGGVLPVMQIVCRDLYCDIPKNSKKRLIDSSILREGKGVAGRLDAHISRSLRAAMEKAGYSRFGLDNEEDKWRSALVQLADFGSDGTARTKIETAGTVNDILTRTKVHEKGREDILKHLTQPGVLVLRRFSFFSPTSEENETLYTLGHDAIGLGLSDWFNRRREARQARRANRAKLVARTAAVIGTIVAFYSTGQLVLENTAGRINTLVAASERTSSSAPLVSAVALLEAERAVQQRWSVIRTLGVDEMYTSQMRAMSGRLAERSYVLSKQAFFGENLLTDSLLLAELGEKQDFELIDLSTNQTVRLERSGEQVLNIRWSGVTKGSTGAAAFVVPYKSAPEFDAGFAEFDATGFIDYRPVVEPITRDGWSFASGEAVIHANLAFFYDGDFALSGARLPFTASMFFDLAGPDLNVARPEDVTIWFGQLDSTPAGGFTFDGAPSDALPEDGDSSVGDGATAWLFSEHAILFRKDIGRIDAYRMSDLAGKFVSPVELTWEVSEKETLEQRAASTPNNVGLHEILNSASGLVPGPMIAPNWSTNTDYAFEAWVSDCTKKDVQCDAFFPQQNVGPPVILWRKEKLTERSTNPFFMPDSTYAYVNLETGKTITTREPNFINLECRSSTTERQDRRHLNFAATFVGDALRVAVTCHNNASVIVSDLTADGDIQTVESVLRWNRSEDRYTKAFAPDGQRLTYLDRDVVITWDLIPERIPGTIEAQRAQICARAKPMLQSMEQEQFAELWKNHMDLIDPPILKDLCL